MPDKVLIALCASYHLILKGSLRSVDDHSHVSAEEGEALGLDDFPELPARIECRVKEL